jgi:hypothetical protein
MPGTRESGSDMVLLDIKRALAALEVELKLCKLAYLLRKYGADQPRVPAGSPEGGQWTSGRGGVGNGNDGGGDPSGEDPSSGGGGGMEGDARVQLAQADPSYDIDLTEQERLGGHAKSKHVAISEAALMTEVVRSSQRITARGDWFIGRTEGSFTSLDSATDLVNATLTVNHEAVEEVARGEAREALVEARFVSRTGYEAYLHDPNSSPYIRDTNAVTVYIRQDSRSPNGFRVQTAYPMNR